MIRFLLLTCFYFLMGCSGKGDSSDAESFSLAQAKWSRDIKAPIGSFIKKKYRQSKAYYHIHLERNLGHERLPTEKAQICRDLKPQDTISWKIGKLTGTHNFRTPIDFVTIQKGGEILLAQKIMNNHIWNDIHNKAKDITQDRLAIYPQKQNVSYRLEHNNHALLFTTKDKETLLPISAGDTVQLCIGLYRTQLMRYRGQVIPAQSLWIGGFSE